MKSKDQQLLEEAYTKINEMDEAPCSCSHEGSSDIDPDTVQMYYSALKKFENNEITSQQWYDICAKLLGDLMEQHRDVFVRLKNR